MTMCAKLDEAKKARRVRMVEGSDVLDRTTMVNMCDLLDWVV